MNDYDNFKERVEKLFDALYKYKKENKHTVSSFDDWLKEEGIYDEVKGKHEQKP